MEFSDALFSIMKVSYFCATLISLLSITNFDVKSQVVENDRWYENLKGNVSKMVECNRKESDRFGEIVATLDTIRTIYFNKSGNIQLSVVREPSFNELFYKHYIYNANEQLSQIDYYMYYPDFIKIAEETFEYDGNLLNTITFKRIGGRYIPTDALSVGARMYYAYNRNTYGYYDKANEDFFNNSGYKIIYKYFDDGYKVTSYDYETGEPFFSYEIKDEGKTVITHNDYSYNVKLYDDYLKVQVSGYGAQADNGSLSGETYYKYDNNANIVFTTSDIEHTKQEYTIAYDKKNYTIKNYYTYEYDETGNWTKVSQYKNNRLDRMYSRSYEYGKYYRVENLIPVKVMNRHYLFVHYNLKQQEHQANKDKYTLSETMKSAAEISGLYNELLQCLGLDRSQKGEIYINYAEIWAEEMSQVELNANFWAAVECLNEAKKLDSTLVDRCDQLIQCYSKSFPEQSELSKYNLNEGDPYEFTCEGVKMKVSARSKK